MRTIEILAAAGAPVLGEYPDLQELRFVRRGRPSPTALRIGESDVESFEECLARGTGYAPPSEHFGHFCMRLKSLDASLSCQKILFDTDRNRDVIYKGPLAEVRFRATFQHLSLRFEAQRTSDVLLFVIKKATVHKV